MPVSQQTSVLERTIADLAYKASVGDEKAADFCRSNGLLVDPGTNGTHRPAPVGPLDVLVILYPSADNGWKEIRGEFVCDNMRRDGLTCDWHGPQRTMQSIRETIQKAEPRLVINRSFYIAPEYVYALSKEFPNTKFLTVNHSSMTYTQEATKFLYWQRASVDLARQERNCWYGTPDERNLINHDGHPRIVWVPNAVKDPGFEGVRLGDPPCLSIISRFQMIKNVPCQMIAASIVQRAVGARILLSCMGTPDDQLKQLAMAYGMNIEVQPWRQWGEYTQMVKECVDIGIVAGYSESFNYVGIEHMLIGRPIAASHAIRYAPNGWQANPDSPGDVAGIIIDHLDEMTDRSVRAREVGVAVMNHNNRVFNETVQRILES